MGNSQQRTFLARFLPIALVVIGITWFYDHSENEHQLGRIKNEELLNVGLGSSSVIRHIKAIVGDLHFLSSHYAMQQVVNDPASPEIQRLETNFPVLIKAKKVYDQVRWIDARGQEIVRADLVNGAAKLVPRAELQNKGDRYYFTEAMRLEPGQIYVSPLDLNVEKGKIELPYKPMLRLATPVADRHGVKQGIVIINYLGKAMLDRFIADSRGGNSHVALLDGKGFWLHAANPADEWGFMFNDEQRTLGSRFPSSWARMKGRHGQFEDENGLWTFESVYPLLTEVLDSQPGANAENEYRWLVVSHLDRATVAAMTSQGRLERLLFAACLLLIAGIGIFTLERGRVREREGRERFHAIFDYAMVGIATISPDKKWISVNPALCRILGYEAGELMQTDWHALTHPDDRAADTDKLNAVLSGKTDGYAMEKRLLGKSGAIVNASISVRAIRKSGEDIDFLVVVLEDISNWVLAESEWSASIKMLQRFIDHLPGSAYVKAADSRILVANRGFQEQFGVVPENILGRPSTEAFPGALGAKMLADDARILATGITERIEDAWNGRIYESTKFVIPRDDGSADLGGITIDVTERRRTEQRLGQQARRSAILLELPKKAAELPEKSFMQYALDLAKELTQSTIGFIHLVDEEGLPSEPIPGTADEPAHIARHAAIADSEMWAEALRKNEPLVVNVPVAAPADLSRLLCVPVAEDGKVRMMGCVGDKAGDYNQFDVETVQLIGNETWRIICRQRTESALRLATQVVNASPVVCYRSRASEDWALLFISDNVRQWGYSAEQLLAGNPAVQDVIHPDDLPRMQAETNRYIADGVMRFALEYRLVTANGQVVWVLGRAYVHLDADGKPEYYDGVLTDITERKNQQALMDDALNQQKKLNKRLEEANNQLMQSEKMASIGQLAAGVAHELNNPIGFVHSNLGTLDGYVHDLMDIIAAYEAMLSQPGEANPHADAMRRLLEQHDFDFLKNDIFSLLAESKDGLGRVRKIVQDLKSFSRVGEQEWQEADLHQGLDSTLNIVWNELKYKAKVIKEYGEIPHVFCLISQLNQVFMNLLVNAGHAIETQGTITIRTFRQDDDKVCVEISDTGKGIAPEHINRIFEPFFTTKPVGKGTGLGLSLSYGIIKRHGGQIEVESSEGHGATFRLILPINPTQNTEIQDSETSS